jgi:hypothetical protein
MIQQWPNPRNGLEIQGGYGFMPDGIGTPARTGYNGTSGARMNTTDWTSGDTRPEAMAKQVEVLRRMGLSGRAAMMFELGDNLRSIVEAGVRLRHADWDSRSVEREVLRLMIGDDLFRQAFGEGQAVKRNTNGDKDDRNGDDQSER